MVDNPETIPVVGVISRDSKPGLQSFSDLPGAYKATMAGMESTEFFQCNRCRIECRIDSVATEQSVAPLIVRHCPGSEGIAILGEVVLFQERRGGLWVDVQRWIDAA